MRRFLPILLLLTLTACTQQGTSGPTAGPGTPSSAPAPSRTPKPTQGRPAGPTPTLGPSPTARATPGQPTPDSWTVMKVPADRVCTISVRRRIGEPFDYGMLHLGSLLFRLEGNPEWLADSGLERKARALVREMQDLPEEPCTTWGKATLVSAAEEMVAAFDLYQVRPEWGVVAIGNARSALTDASLWFVGSRWWSTVAVPLH